MTELPPRTFGPVSRTDIVRYQGASGDFNPIHHDEPFALGAGAPTVFSVGMLQAGFIATYCTDLFGVGSISAFDTRFHDRVWPDDVLTCRGTCDASRVTVELTNARGLVASATVVIRDRVERT